MTSSRILILGGSTEAGDLADLLAGDSRFDATMSLAGRTRAPRQYEITTRSGGFGGTEGLVRYLRDARADAIVDATHPFAAMMSRNVAIAAQSCSVPLLAIRRPPWLPRDGDRWLPVGNMAEAAAALGAETRKVLLTIGRQDVAAFCTAPQHRYVVRSVDAPAPASLPPLAEVILARGPFGLPGERQLLEEHEIDVLVTRNSGGPATEAKLTAARQLGLPVVMAERPAKPPVPAVTTAEEAFRWLVACHAKPFAAPRGL